ncbi:sulfur oxidation c-type cytochrome SoxA [Iodidimonas sp. SYSU 1G8]|uniref:sulfur oxidation c-type cytochrome SoxA n=1 Tax=Iodidimonas sp. SYSU 1G8 TaxID=3133967 RepID=UPI0031FE453B
MRRRCLALAFLFLTACGDAEPGPDRADLDRDTLVSGYAFLTRETQREQDDEFLNPGFLWVDRGAGLFNSADAVRASCASCHGAGDRPLAGVAARYPRIDEETGKLTNLEGRINFCRIRHQAAEPLAPESEDLLALSAYVASLSRGVPIGIEPDERLAPYYAKGRDYFFTRRGQLNLACHHCHDRNWGRALRGDTISQGHGNGFPAYRLEWQSLGSLHRRFRDCDTGVRAAPRPLQSEDYLALELYLAQRASGLAVETPAIRP